MCIRDSYRTTDLYGTYEAKGDQYSSFYDGNNMVPDDLARLVRKYCADEMCIRDR